MGVEVSTSTLTIREGETVSYSARLSEQPLANGWWLFVQVDGVVYHDGEFTKDGETEPWVRWAPSVGWALSAGSPGPTPWRTVSITAPQDADSDDEFLTFTHEVWDEKTACPDYLHAVAPVRVRIIDDDRAGGAAPDLAIADAEATEGGIATFAVTLSSTSEVPVTVSFETMDGRATTDGSDYTSKSGTLTFASGERLKRIEVQTLRDTEQEGAETFTVQLSGVSGATLTDGVAIGTILDDYVEPPPLAIADAQVTEGGLATFEVTLGPGATGPVTVSFETRDDGTATDGSDYTGKSGTLTFTAGQRTKQIQVQTIHDTMQEEAEDFTVQLSGVSGATLTDGVAIGTILDDDDNRPPLAIADASVTEGGLAAFDVTLGSGATGPVTVSYQTENGMATAGSDYTSKSGTLTFASGERLKRIEVQTLDDDEAEESAP